MSLFQLTLGSKPTHAAEWGVGVPDVPDMTDAGQNAECGFLSIPATELPVGRILEGVIVRECMTETCRKRVVRILQAPHQIGTHMSLIWQVIQPNRCEQENGTAL